MPRGKRHLSLDEQIIQVTENIQITEEALQTLRSHLTELEEQKHQEHLELIYQHILSSGRTVEEALELLDA